MCVGGGLSFQVQDVLFADGHDIVKPYNAAAVNCADIYVSSKKSNRVKGGREFAFARQHMT